MKVGRKPKPTILKILAGNPGKRPLPENEPQPEAGLPRCPKRLTGDARKLWYAIGKQLADCGVMTLADGQAFELLISAYVEYCEAAAKVAQTGPVWMAKKDDSKIPEFVFNPYWKQSQKAEAKLLALLREFGMTPQARASLKASPRVSQQEENPLEMLKAVQ